jgi:small GTP-binding protein
MEDMYRKKSLKNVESHDYYKYKISYTMSSEHGLMFLFVTGLSDSAENVKKELLKCKKEFLSLFSDILEHHFDAKTFDVFNPTVDGFHRNLRPKISLVGFSGVGKTTITRLIKAEEIPMKHVPTITGDIATIKIGKLHFHLWDFAGQEQFSYLWTNFVKGSDAVLLITDSSLENVEKSKFFLELIKEQSPYSHTAVIGNKQDLPESLKPGQIEKILSLKTYSMIANNSDNRNKMIQIIADILEMSAEISPLLKPLLERDKLTEEAMFALENGKFSEAAMLFEKISDLCIDLGDDTLGKEFYEKFTKINAMLDKVGAPQQPPAVEPIKPDIPKPTPPPPMEPMKTEISKPPPPPPPPMKPEISKPPPPPPPVEPMKTEIPKPAKNSTFEQIGAVNVPKELQEPLDMDHRKLKKKKKEKAPKKKKEKKAKKKKLKKSKKVIASQEPEESVVSSIIQEPSFLKRVEDANELKRIKAPSSPPKPKETYDDSWMPPALKKLEKGELPKTLIEAMKAEEEVKKPISKPFIRDETTGIQLNPEDFIIRERPKEAKAIVSSPKNAKVKLKTSAYGHVLNPDEIKAQTPEPVSPKKLTEQKPKGPVPVAPTKLINQEPDVSLIKPSIPPAPEISKVPEVLETPVVHTPPQKVEKSLTEVTEVKFNKKELENQLMDLKIQHSKLEKLAIDFDMQELTGEITTEQLKEKKGKLETMEIKINEQIQEIQEILKNLD